jgi:predicted pyridoxine 5'-phosphate oxidase superfamily flavin-nucleotide-binding protein
MGILTEDMRRVVEEQRLGFVATVCPDRTPNVSPKGTVAVWDDDTLVFADIRSPRTVANLRQNPAVEINVVDPLARKGYRFKGTGAVHAEGPIFDEGVAFFRRRDVANPIRAIVLVRVTWALLLLSPAYDQGQSEEQVRDHWRRYRDEVEARYGG